MLRCVTLCAMPKRLSAAETSDKRAAVIVSLTPEANRVVNLWADRTGAKKTKTVARLLEWFAAGPESMQQAIVGNVPSDMGEDYVKRAAEFFEAYMRQVVNGNALSVPAEGEVKPTMKLAAHKPKKGKGTGSKPSEPPPDPDKPLR